MEDYTYDTGAMNFSDTRKFKQWLDKNIGTEFEQNYVDHYDDGKYVCALYSLTVFSLTHKEVEMIRAYENKETK